ncbi:hypothetical protein ASZ90_010471 [hydrocarbon metagenome]|uniref:histidine kinase n=1 Tax=hydrocarbon metagenome TaxID=938273 RepID=A0A0W8FGM4_9ZZZZ
MATGYPDHRIEALRRRMEALDRHDLGSRGSSELPPEAIEDLAAVLEGLQTVGTELCEKHAELNAMRHALEIERGYYRDFFTSADEGFLVTDTDGTIREANPAAAALLGTARTALVDKPLALFVAGSDLAVFRTLLDRSLTWKGTLTGEILLQQRGGDSIRAAVALAPVRAPAGMPPSLRWTLRPAGDPGEAQGRPQQMESTVGQIRELECLYAISRLAETPGIPLDDLLRRIVALVPAAWQCPEKMCARIVLEDRTIATGNYRESPVKQTSGIPVFDRKSGVLEVCCMQDLPEQDAALFPEGADGIVTRIAGAIGSIIERRQEEEYRRVKDFAIASSINAVAIADLSGNLTSANRAFLEMWGYADAVEVEGRSILAFWQEADEAARVLDVLLREGAWMGELAGSKKDGAVIDVRVSANRVAGASGNPLCLIIFFVDITGQKRAERALRESEARYRMLAEAAPDAVFLLDAEGRVEYLNRHGARMCGEDPRFIPGMPLWQALPGEMGARFREMIETASASGKPVSDECRFSLPDQDRWLDNRCIPVAAEDGSAGSVMVISRDVTGHQEALEEIRTKNWQLSVLNQIIGVSSLSFSLDELLEMALEKTLELLGFDVGLVYLLETDRKRAILQFCRGAPPSYPRQHRAIMVHHWPNNYIFVAGQPRYIADSPETPLSSIEADMLRDLEISSVAIIPLVAESVVVGALYVGSREERGLLEEKKVILEAIGREIGSGILKGILYRRLEAAHREANLYLDIMTHDIKNAENVSGLYIDLLVDMLDGEVLEYAKKLRGSIQKSIEIINNVSTIRRIHQDTAQLKPARLDPVIREEIAHFPGLRIAYEGCSAVVEADDLLPEVFSNLLGNAAKFGGPDVGITIRVEELEDLEALVLVSVEDTGPGIPDELKDTIFHRFERGPGLVSGEGLGLYISRKLVERYGGRIWVEDRVGGRPECGAVFKILLKDAGRKEGFEE